MWIVSDNSTECHFATPPISVWNIGRPISSNAPYLYTKPYMMFLLRYSMTLQWEAGIFGLNWRLRSMEVWALTKKWKFQYYFRAKFWCSALYSGSRPVIKQIQTKSLNVNTNKVNKKRVESTQKQYINAQGAQLRWRHFFDVFRYF